MQESGGGGGGGTDTSSDAVLRVKDQVNTALQAVAEKKHGGYALRPRSASAAASGWCGLYFDPTGGFRRVWDSVLCVLLLYVATFSVFVYCFYPRLTPSSFFFWVERLMDLAFATDILLCFVTGYIRHDRVMETRGRVIATRYARTWLLPDILSTFPWDVLSLAFSAESSVLFKLLRFLRLLRLSKLVSLFRRARMRNSFTRVEVRMHIKYAYLRMLYLLAMVLLLAHWIGCLFYFIGSLAQPGEDSWLLQDDIPDDLFGRWVASVFFSAATVTTIGYGDITPRNTRERCYTVIVMFMGAACFAFVITNVASLVSELSVNSMYHRTQMDQLSDYARLRKLPSSLAFDIRRYFQHRYERLRIANEKQLLDAMSPDLRAQVMAYTYGKALSRATLLRDLPPAALAHVCSQAQELFFRPDELVYRAGDTPDALYVLMHGEATLEAPDNETDRDRSGGSATGGLAAFGNSLALGGGGNSGGTSRLSPFSSIDSVDGSGRYTVGP